jgi:hypothetical protein
MIIVLNSNTNIGGANMSQEQCDCVKADNMDHIALFALAPFNGKGILRFFLIKWLKKITLNEGGRCICGIKCGCDPEFKIPNSGRDKGVVGGDNYPDWARASGATWAPPLVDPLVIDLNRDGTTNLTNSVYFDLDVNGFAEATNWIDGADGLLVMDRPVESGGRLVEKKICRSAQRIGEHLSNQVTRRFQFAVNARF